jgi:hypothetical protein
MHEGGSCMLRPAPVECEMGCRELYLTYSYAFLDNKLHVDPCSLGIVMRYG